MVSPHFLSGITSALIEDKVFDSPCPVILENDVNQALFKSRERP